MRFLSLFALVALAEMATFFWVESLVGLGWALSLALGTAVVGSSLVRRAGLSVLGRIQARFGDGELPGRELSHGASILVAGAFLISPGFITDVMGFLLLIPKVRDMVHVIVSRRLMSRMTVVTTSRQPFEDRKRGPARPFDTSGEDIIDIETLD